MHKGYLAILLHAHLPFVRHPEFDDPFEENWLFEAISECYVPFIWMLEGLDSDNIRCKLILSLSPTLAAMLQDPFLQYRYLKRLDCQQRLAELEVERTRGQGAFHSLAQFYRQRFERIRKTYENKYTKNLVQAFKIFMEKGFLEIIATTATHGYLPLLAARPSAVQAQVRIGIDYYRTLFDQKPAGFWLPECGYSPGIDSVLANEGICFSFLETHGITRATPRPCTGVYAPLETAAGIKFFGRDPESSRQIWSAEAGYPGAHEYREFYRDIAHELDPYYLAPFIHHNGTRQDSGFKYYRITGRSEQKAIYSPLAAAEKAKLDAEDFIRRKKRQFDTISQNMEGMPVVLVSLDMELFGHWWFEGPIWLDHLIRMINREKDAVALTSITDYLTGEPAIQEGSPSASSWGKGGFHENWINSSNDWIYPHLYQSAIIMEELAGRYDQTPTGDIQRLLRQAARENLLAQSSDWAFMLTANTMPDYARKRVDSHCQALLCLKKQLEENEIDQTYLEMLESRSNLFADVDYRGFAKKPV